MDAFDLFKKLGSGAKFNFKRFHDDAQKLKIPHSLPQRTSLSRPDVPKAKIDDPPSKKPRLDEDEDESSDEEDSAPEAETELQLLGSIRSAGDDTVQNNKKKNKKSKKLTAKKRAQIQQEQINHCRNQNHIHVHGTDIPDPVVTFDQLSDDYKLHPRIIENLRKVGYENPTPIQMQAVPVMLHRREILACAPTGSGKTASFILPILHHLKEPRKQGFRALVLAPTRELAKQTHQWFTRLSEGLGFRIHYIEKVATAEKKFGPKSSQKFDILVTTPNRLVYMLQQDPPVINLDSVEWLVVDESDKLFEEGKRGFRDQLAAIYKACQGSKVRRAMFSATFAHQVEEWCKLNLDNVVQVYIGARNVATETIKQELVFVGTEAGKLLAVRDIIKKGIQPPVLVFVQSKERAKELFSELIYDGINVDVIHADRTQLQRDNTVKSFRTGQIWVLICTELMGRGIDFQGVNLVINYDFPNSAISYIHRIGRTGRAGRQGRAITFFTEDDSVNLRSIANIMREAGCPVPEYMLQMKRPSKKVRRKLAKNVPKREKIAASSKFDLKRNQMKRNKESKKKSKSQTPESTSAMLNAAESGHLGKENSSSREKKHTESGLKQTPSSKKGKKKKKKVSGIET